MAKNASLEQSYCVEIKQKNTPQRHKVHKEAKNPAISTIHPNLCELCVFVVHFAVFQPVQR
jgi:hypothetical protein